MSETPKFTPGPWKWWTSNSWRRLTAHNGPGGQYIREGDVLCPIIASDGHPDCIVTEANMALMGAGPEMHAALKRAHDMLQAVAGDIEDGGSLDSLRGKYVLAILGVRDAAYAALAKAEGRS
jgi:hypothetical protein